MCMVLTVSLMYQGYTTAGYCRYRQANPVGRGGRLDLDANFGIRKAFLPQVWICTVISILDEIFIACACCGSAFHKLRHADEIII